MKYTQKMIDDLIFGGIINDVNFDKCDLSCLDLARIVFKNCSFRYAILTGTDLTNANLTCANLADIDLHGAILAEANLSGANLAWSILTLADLARANLSGAYLAYANLSGANLSGAYLNGVIGNKKQVKSLQLETYSITYTSEVIQIGCKNYTIDEWKNFTDKEISKMDQGALEWWKKYKDILFQIIELSPATKTN